MRAVALALALALCLVAVAVPPAQALCLQRPWQIPPPPQCFLKALQQASDFHVVSDGALLVLP